MVHLVYCNDKEKVLEKILSGEKTMAIRGAAGRKIPHSRVFEKELLYFMKKGTKEISAMAVVKSVQNFMKLTDNEIHDILEKNEEELQLSAAEKERWHKKCLCLVEFEQLKRIDPPLEFDHQKNMDDWLILEKIEDAVVGSSIPYNYEKSRFR